MQDQVTSGHSQSDVHILWHIPELTVSLKNNLETLKKTGPGCLKLTTLLVNVSLKFQTFISKICQYFFIETRGPKGPEPLT